MGFLEAKDPEKPLDNLRGRDREQQEKYRELPNLLYTNFWDLNLFQEKNEVQQALLVPRPCLDPTAPYTALISGSCG